jgi:DNA topoisomerase-1
LRDREYVEIDNRRFTATDIGRIVGKFLTEHFHRYVEYGFTAAMEDELDAVARGEEPWTVPLAKFWKPFITQVELIEKSVSREQVAQARELGRDPVSGKPVTVRMGRFGPFVQIGTKDDVEKPRFAGLRPGQKMDTIQLADAFELFKLPRTLGTTAEGDPVTTAIGRFGPYIKYGAKYVSLKEDDPYTVTHERALEVIAAKVLADANRIIQDFPADKIQVLNGRYGPYITDTAKNARVPKDRDPKTLTLEECKALLLTAPAKGTRGRFGRKLPAKRGAADKPAAAAPEATAAGDTTKAKSKTKAEAKSPAKAKAKAKARSKAPAASRQSEPLADEVPADEAPPKMVAAGRGSTKR